MFFQISVTPKAKKTSESSSQAKEMPNKDFHIILAPFQPQTRIIMETSVNTKTESFLHVKNTGNRALNVNITKRPPPERNVDLSFQNSMIEANGSVSLEITWFPKEAGSWREVLQLTDGRRVKYEIPLIMQAQDFRKKDSKLRPKVRKPLISKSNTTQQSYPPRNTVALQKEPSFDKKQIQPRTKRTRFDTCLDEPDKENIAKNIEYDKFIESTITKKQRKEIFATTSISTDAFTLTPVQFNEKLSETQTKDYNFSPQESFIIMEERIETKTLRRETYVKTPNYRRMIKIEEYDEKEDAFEDSLSPPKASAVSDFSLLIDNINLTPKLPITPEVFEFSPRASSTGSKSDSSKLLDSVTNSNTTFSIAECKEKENRIVCFPLSPKRGKQTFLKPTRLAQTFDVLTPITPAPRRKVEFASSSLLSMDCSNMETPRRHFNTSHRDLDSSTVKEILEADMWVKPQNILPVKRVPEKVPIKKRKENLSETFELKEACLLEISPPKACNSQKSPRKYYRPVDKTKRVSPCKAGKVTKFNESLGRKKQLSTSFKNSIPGVRISNLSLSGITRKKNQTLLKETSVKLHDPNDFITKFCNPDPFAATTTEDPFLSSTLYYDEKWVFHQEVKFKKWLNALMSPPEHLNTDVDTNCVDIGKLWQTCRTQENDILAESKESISARIHTDTRLNTLRKAACMMFRNPEVSNILSRTIVCVEKGILVIRQDRDLHRDIGLQKGILELFLSYNPLWLRIGLETVYGETIPLRSNNDLIGLTRFLLVRFFSDQFIIKQHSHPTVAGMKLPTFTSSMNKFMLKKFLLLVFFLDFAKSNKLIGHDPCLFHKKAPHKESRSILLTFSREVLSGIGDITKVLKAYEYIVSHKQTFLDEFDYAVNDMSSDLRDGVRLCRAMELITGNRNLTCQCRVPAISRLQKIHNVNIALKALLDSGYTLAGDIDAKSISDGHREKTLSLLWQIIYKFQAPRFEKAATCVQTWWRSKLWYIRVKNMLKNRKINAACVIQRAWKCHRARKILKNLQKQHEKEMRVKNKAASVIQKMWILRKEGKTVRGHFLEKRAAASKIQNWWRRIQETKPFVERLKTKKSCILFVQRAWRAKKLMETKRSEYLHLQEVCRKMQIRWRAKLFARTQRAELETLKQSVLFLQRKWRALKAMKKDRESFERISTAARRVQKWWRGILLMKRDRNNFILKKYAVRVFEKKWIEKKTISEERKNYLQMKHKAIIIQRTWRRYKETKPEVSRFKFCKISSIKIQSWWRMIIVRNHFQSKRKSCLKIQDWWRSSRLTKICELEYSRKKKAALVLQKNWRMLSARRIYWHMKSAVLIIESWYENILLSRTIRNEFLAKKKATLKIGDWWLNKKSAEAEREKYLKLKTNVVNIQRRWREKKLSEETRRKFLSMKISAVKIQSWFRMKKEKQKFEAAKAKLAATVTIQRKWRAVLLRREVETDYKNIRKATIFLQRRWRATKLAEAERIRFLETRERIIKIQTQWRCFVASKNFQRQKQAAIKIQNWWRHKSSGIKIRNEYLQLRCVTITLQNRIRRNQIASRTKENYLRFKEAAIKIQKRWRAIRIGREIRKEFSESKRVIIFVQSKWRMKIESIKYRKYKQSVLKVQTIWRANRLAKETRQRYLHLKSSALVIQSRWRETKLRNEIRKQFLEYRRSVVIIQSTWRMKLALKKYKALKQASMTIQCHWRARTECKKSRESFLALKSATLLIQRKFRAKKLAEIEIEKFSLLKKSSLLIQRKWRAELAARECRAEFTSKKVASMKIQKWWRSILAMRKCRNDYLEKKAVVLKLQRRYRGNLLTREARIKYEDLRKKILRIQTCWRFVLARREMKSLLIRRKKAVDVIENWWLEILRMKRIKEEKREKMRKLNYAAAKIQAAWRGLKVRQANTKRMAELRKRTEEAARLAIPAQTLASRLQDAINVFLFSNDLGRLSLCLSSLDLITRLSPNGCLTVCKAGLVDKIYMTLVRSNRSVPWMDACTRATSILITLAKYSPTKEYILKVDYIETLARLLTVTIEKEVQLFLHLSTLIWTLVEDRDYAKAILNDSRSVWLLNSLCDTVSRKRQRNTQVALKAAEEVLPNPKPDWGLRQKQPRLFSNVFYAATSILRRLNEHQESD